jgi:hypothetical protein
MVIDLATRARHGEQQAWNALVERYSPLIWSICRKHRLSDAEDAGQSVWLLLAQQLVASGRAGALNCGHGHRAIFEIYRIQKICAVAAPHVAASQRHSSECAAVLPVRETGQQWPMSKLFGAAVTTADVLR